MSAQAVAAPIVELLPELELAAPAITGQEVVWQQSSSENASTGASNLAAEYGLDGSGQTVAVIDSGIAWDHYAFGGKFGEGNHVVGGWDFAENDANPYDDGPIGYHGSHVAGIIGSLDSQYKGVASGADLVSLRVFDDSGIGKLEWVEQALRWVHEHKDAFENPITTVNLSLGSGWNPDTTPGWGQLEDELATLKNDGIFISVAAGNYFKQINDVGLSYPAVSEHVVPVSSHGDDGQLSDFSQRDDRVLVAPGEMLRSPVPDHLFGGMKTGQFLASSGTSMAAPFVAGVSSVLREANWFMGETEVTQDMLYEQLWLTADEAYDSITGRTYRNINFEAALDHVIADRFADSLSNATDLGSLDSGDRINGTIGKLNDVDAIKFTATETGRVQLTLSSTHDLAPEVETAAANLTIEGNTISFDVIDGQTYGFLISTSVGTGHYEIDVNYEGQEVVPATDLGVIVANEFTGLQVNHEGGYQVTPVRNGLMSVEALVGPSDQILIEVYNSQGELVGSTSELHNVEGTDGLLSRLDVNVQAGEDYFIKFSSSDAERLTNVRVSNLVQVEGRTVSVHGTSQNDTFEVTHTSNGQQDQLQFSVNGFNYTFSTDEFDHARLQGHGGQDEVKLNLSDRNDKVTTRSDGVFVGNSEFRLNAFSIESQVVAGGGGFDTILMQGSHQADHFWTGESDDSYWTTRTGSEFSSRATGFEIVHAISGSHDTVQLNGTSGNETFVSRDGRGSLRLDGITVVADQFENLDVFGGGGRDRTNLFDSVNNDTFSFQPDIASIRNQNYSVEAHGFARVNAFSRYGGQDSLQLADAQGEQNDSFTYRDDRTMLDGSGYNFYGLGFESVRWTSSGGNDLAQIFDTSANDTFRGTDQCVRNGRCKRNRNGRGCSKRWLCCQPGRIRSCAIGRNRRQRSFDDGFPGHPIDSFDGSTSKSLRGRIKPGGSSSRPGSCQPGWK